MNALPPVGGWEQYKTNDGPSSPRDDRVPHGASSQQSHQQHSSITQLQQQAPEDGGYVQDPPQVPPSSSLEPQLLPQQQAEQWAQIVTGQDSQPSTLREEPSQQSLSVADAYNVASVNIPLNVPADVAPSASGGGSGGVDVSKTLNNFKDTWDPYETTDIPMFWHS